MGTNPSSDSLEANENPNESKVDQLAPESQSREAASFEEQVSRVRRFLDRIEKQKGDWESYEDDLWAFFQNCWHLKDWIKHDPILQKLDPKIGDSIEQDVARFESLMICAAVATRSKYVKLCVKRKTEEVSKERSNKVSSSVSLEYAIDLDVGSTRSALEVAREAVADWEKLISEYKKKYKL